MVDSQFQRKPCWSSWSTLLSAFYFPKQYSLFVGDHDDEDSGDTAEDDDDGEGE